MQVIVLLDACVIEDFDAVLKTLHSATVRTRAFDTVFEQAGAESESRHRSL